MKRGKEPVHENKSSGRAASFTKKYTLYAQRVEHERSETLRAKEAAERARLLDQLRLDFVDRLLCAAPGDP